MACKHCDMSELFVGQRVVLRGGGLVGRIIEINGDRNIRIEYGSAWGNVVNQLTYGVTAIHPVGCPDRDAQCWILIDSANPLEVL